MKKAAVVVLIVFIAIGGLLYYLWRQATLLPEWYQTGKEGAPDKSVVWYEKDMEAARAALEREIEDQLRRSATRNGQVEVVLDENDANRLFATLISENSAKYPYLTAVKASKTRIRDGNLDFGVVVDASEILKNVPEQGAEEARPETAPLSGLLQEREVSLGFTGKLETKDGHLQPDEEGKIRIGGLTFSLKTIAKRLNISEDKLKGNLKDFQVGKLKIDTIKPGRNTLLLKGALPPS
ncbi:MAG: hypothetical protein K9N21_03295 [Deltaproteobacteria bacterium]|nr:hypothetical protein [Deltaproteobacteria bacterium]